ncbi:3-ketodihydrosphingosine reductase-like protein, partial [Dinothrombium tinctorium]
IGSRLAMFLIVVTAIVFVFFVLFLKRQSKFKRDLTAKHILITGGSKGIGKAIAIECFKNGANLSLFARNERELQSAKQEIEKHAINEQQCVHYYAIDVSADYENVKQTVAKCEQHLGPIHVLFNCVGNAVSHRFDETAIDDFKKMIEVNYLASVYCTKAVLASMKARREGRIVLFSSIAGLIGIYGFSAYSAAKFALTGFAQSLRMELKPFNISITVAFPPDTDTPGFAKEQETKPLETKLISEGGGLFSPELVAEQTLKDTFDGKFASTLGLESFAVKMSCSGMFPVDSVKELLLQIATLGIFRALSVCFLYSCDRIVRKHASAQSVPDKKSM